MAPWLLLSTNVNREDLLCNLSISGSHGLRFSFEQIEVFVGAKTLFLSYATQSSAFFLLTSLFLSSFSLSGFSSLKFFFINIEYSFENEYLSKTLYFHSLLSVCFSFLFYLSLYLSLLLYLSAISVSLFHSLSLPLSLHFHRSFHLYPFLLVFLFSLFPFPSNPLHLYSFICVSRSLRRDSLTLSQKKKKRKG